MLFVIPSSTRAEDMKKNAKKQSIIDYPKRTYQDWNPCLAEKEAISDIENKTIKIYYVGGYVPVPAGLSKEEILLVIDYPMAAAGPLGCIVEEKDIPLRERQVEYAEKYNRIIINYLKTQPSWR